jgi:hypothetical protein
MQMCRLLAIIPGMPDRRNSARRRIIAASRPFCTPNQNPFGKSTRKVSGMRVSQQASQRCWHNGDRMVIMEKDTLRFASFMHQEAIQPGDR